jgi:hypothetical protein
MDEHGCRTYHARLLRTTEKGRSMESPSMRGKNSLLFGCDIGYIASALVAVEHDLNKDRKWNGPVSLTQ